MIALEEWLLARQLACRFVFAREFSGCNFAGFDVWLVEGVDADDRACHGCGDLPAEKFFADSVWILHCDTHDRLACFLQRFHRGVLSAIRRAFQAETRENTVRPAPPSLHQTLP